MHRIGQDKETHFVKIVVKDSIDEGLLELQQGKAQMISKALQEDAGRKTAPSLGELVRLFGVGEGVGGEGGEGGEGVEGVEGGGGGGEGGGAVVEGEGGGEGGVVVAGREGGGEGGGKGEGKDRGESAGEGGEREVVVVDDDDDAEGDRIDRVGEAAEAGAGEEIEGS